MLEYTLNNKEMLVRIFFEHLNIVGTTMLIGIVISLILTYLIVNAPILYEPFMTFFRIVYTIPSLAFFAILIPFTGIGNKTAIIVLTSYTLFYLVNNFLLGIRNIDRDVLDSANAVGYTKLQTYIHVLLPLALPSIYDGNSSCDHLYHWYYDHCL